MCVACVSRLIVEWEESSALRESPLTFFRRASRRSTRPSISVASTFRLRWVADWVINQQGKLIVVCLLIVVYVCIMFGCMFGLVCWLLHWKDCPKFDAMEALRPRKNVTTRCSNGSGSIARLQTNCSVEGALRSSVDTRSYLYVLLCICIYIHRGTTVYSLDKIILPLSPKNCNM